MPCKVPKPMIITVSLSYLIPILFNLLFHASYWDILWFLLLLPTWIFCYMAGLKGGITGISASIVLPILVEYPGTIEQSSVTLLLSGLVCSQIIFAAGTLFLLRKSRRELFRSQQSLLEMEKKYHTIVDHTLAGIFILQDKQIVFSNKRLSQILGYTPDDFLHIHYGDLLVQEDFMRAQEDAAKLIGGVSKLINGHYRAVTQDQKIIHVQIQMSLFEVSDKTAIIGTMLDITDRVQAEQAALESEKRFHTLVELSPDMILIHQEGRILYMNTAGLNMLGAENWKEVDGKPMWDLFSASGRNDLKQIITGADYIPGSLSYFEKTLIRLDGTRLPVEATVAPTLFRGKVAVQIIIRDITRRKAAEAKINYLAHHDSLTGLPNRRMFQKFLKKSISNAHRFGHEIAVLIVDLDRYKTVNDTLGHDMGDLVLQQAAMRMKNNLDSRDMISRQGGDEFILCLVGVTKKQVEQTAEKIRKSIEIPFCISGHEIYLSASIGISMYPGDGLNDRVLMKKADIAVYRSKTGGKNLYSFYTLEMDGGDCSRNLESDMRRGIRNGEFLVYYQPKIDMERMRVSGVEALARWYHPELGLIEPSHFIPLAEETGLIVEIGEQMLRSSCRQGRRWMDQGWNITLNVNLSARQFRHEGLIPMVMNILNESEFPPHLLTLEITETMAMHNIDHSILKLKELRKVGTKLSIDDFGTGYSSLNYLKKFPVDSLKIDRSFVSGVTTDYHDASIVQAIIQVAHSLNLTVVAEGIESKEQLCFLKQNGCNEAQGYYFSRPVPADEAEFLFSNTFNEISHCKTYYFFFRKPPVNVNQYSLV